MKMEGGAPPLHEDGAVGAVMEGIWSGRRRLLVASVRAGDVKWIGKAVVVVIVVSRVERRVSQGMVVCLGIFGKEGLLVGLMGLEVKEGMCNGMGMVF